MPIKRDLNSYFSLVQSASNGSSNTGRKSYKVENAFTPVLKDGKYSVVLRFLPPNKNEIAPFVENRTHMFQLQNGSWFGCDCLGKWGKPCPICDFNRAAWKKYGREEGRNHVLGKAKPKYITNVLIVRNPNAPETEGKVFRFEFGPLIMKMISEAMTDHEDNEAGLIKGFNPFDWKTGANFVYEGVQVGKFTKNDSSHFGTPKPINRWNGKTFVELSDDEIDAIESQLYTLDECEHKEEDVKNYQQILDNYLSKNGSPLFEPDMGFSVAQVASQKVADVVSSIESETPSYEPNTAAATDEEVTDSDDFFSRLANS